MRVPRTTHTSRLAEASNDKWEKDQERIRKAQKGLVSVSKGSASRVDASGLKALNADRRIKKAWARGKDLFVQVHDAAGWGSISTATWVQEILGFKGDRQWPDGSKFEFHPAK